MCVPRSAQKPLTSPFETSVLCASPFECTSTMRASSLCVLAVLACSLHAATASRLLLATEETSCNTTAAKWDYDQCSALTGGSWGLGGSGGEYSAAKPSPFGSAGLSLCGVGPTRAKHTIEALGGAPSAAGATFCRRRLPQGRHPSMLQGLLNRGPGPWRAHPCPQAGCRCRCP